MTALLPPGSLVDPSHVLAIWVEPETLERVGVGALPLGVDLYDLRNRRPPAGLWDEGPVQPRTQFPPEPMKTELKIDNFPTGSVDIQADFLFRVAAFMESECSVIRVETKGTGTDAPLKLTGFRDAPDGRGGYTFDDTKPVVIAVISPRSKNPILPAEEWDEASNRDSPYNPHEEPDADEENFLTQEAMAIEYAQDHPIPSQSAPESAVTSPDGRVQWSDTPNDVRTDGEPEGQASTDEPGRAASNRADTGPQPADRTSDGQEIRPEDL